MKAKLNTLLAVIAALAVLSVFFQNCSQKFEAKDRELTLIGENISVQNPYAVIQASRFDTQAGIQVTDGIVGYTDAGDYIEFKHMDFDQDGAKSVTFSIAAPPEVAGKQIQIRSDSTSGPLLGTLTVASTDAWTQFQNQSLNFGNPVKGITDIFIVFSGGKDVANLKSIQFSKSTVTIPMPQPQPEPTPGAGATNSINEIIADMQSLNEASSSFGPKFSALSYAGSVIPDGGVNRVGGWAMIVAQAGGTQATNTRVAVKDFNVYILRRSTNKWVQISYNPVYNGDPGTFTAAVYGTGAVCPSGCHLGSDGKTCDCDYLKSTNLRPEALLAAVSAMIPNNIYYQPWSFGNFSYTGDVKALFATYQVCLIVHNPGGVDDRAKAKYVANAGADWYRDRSWSHDAGNSRWKVVTNDWRSVNFITIKGSVYPNGDEGSVMSADDLRKNPPPF
jgi:hypothetical protein